MPRPASLPSALCPGLCAIGCCQLPALSGSFVRSHVEWSGRPPAAVTASWQELHVVYAARRMQSEPGS